MPRETSIDILVTELENLISPWRQATVSAASKSVPPHISLLYPWRSAPVDKADINALREVVRDHRSLQLKFTGIDNFPNGTIYLGIEKTPELTLLIRKIFKAFPDTPPYGGEFPDPMPHLTIAKSSDAELEELMQEISAVLSPKLPIEIALHEIVVMEEDETGNWKIHTRIPLDE